MPKIAKRNPEKDETPLPKKVKTKWREGQFEIVSTPSSTGIPRRREVYGFMYGEIAMYPSDTDSGEERWNLCALRIPECRLVQVKTNEDAIKIAEYLWDNYPEAFLLESRKEINEVMPEFVKDWIRACFAVNKCLDIKSFKY